MFLLAIFCGPYPPQRLRAIIRVSNNFHNLFDAVYSVEDDAYTSAAMRPVAIGLDPPAIKRVPCCLLCLWILDLILYPPTLVSSNCSSAPTFLFKRTRALAVRPDFGRILRRLKHELIESNRMAGSSQLIQIELGAPPRMPKPQWLRAKAPVGENFHNLKKLARGLGLHTVCESAQCPNIGECWNHKTATFMLLGNICTRRCGFCAVPKGRPQPIDKDEPRRVAEAVATLGLKHAVVTSVNRDDDNIGSARIFAETIREIRELTPDCRVEVLIPDFQGLEESLRIVLEAKPDVLNHNTETVPRLYRVVRSGARYERTLTLLENAKKFSPGMVTKSGVMVGLGESSEELIEVFRDLGMRGVDILTVGQYLRPSKDHLPIARFYEPAEFTYLREQALRFGFRHVESGPLVRSSYHAHEHADAAARPRAVS